MINVTIKQKIAKLEALQEMISRAHWNRECYMTDHGDGVKSAPLLDDESSEYDFVRYKAWDEICTILEKEVTKA